MIAFHREAESYFEQTEPKSKAEPDLIWFPSSEPRRRFLKKQEQDGKSCFALQTRDKDALLCRLWLWNNFLVDTAKTTQLLLKQKQQK